VIDKEKAIIAGGLFRLAPHNDESCSNITL